MNRAPESNWYSFGRDQKELDMKLIHDLNGDAVSSSGFLDSFSIVGEMIPTSGFSSGSTASASLLSSGAAATLIASKRLKWMGFVSVNVPLLICLANLERQRSNDNQ